MKVEQRKVYLLKSSISRQRNTIHLKTEKSVTNIFKKEFEVADAKFITSSKWTLSDVGKALEVWLRAFLVVTTLSATLFLVWPLIPECVSVPFWRPFPSLVPSLLRVTPSLMIRFKNSPLPFGSGFCIFKTTMLGSMSSSSELRKKYKIAADMLKFFLENYFTNSLNSVKKRRKRKQHWSHYI